MSENNTGNSISVSKNKKYLLACLFFCVSQLISLLLEVFLKLPPIPIPLPFIVLGIATCVFLLFVIRYEKQEIRDERSSVEKLNVSTNISNKESELQDLTVKSMIHKKDFFLSVKRFADEIEILEGIQLFCFSQDVQEINEKKVETIKITYYGGYVKEKTESNCLLSSTFHCDATIYYKLHNLLDKRHKFYAENKYKSADLDELLEIIEKAEQLFNEIVSKFMSVKSREINDSHYFYYRALRILDLIIKTDPKAKLNPQMHEENKTYILKKNRSVEMKLKNGKKTGVIGAALLGDLYDFPNNHIKKYRQYFCAPVHELSDSKASGVADDYTVAVYIFPREKLQRSILNIDNVHNKFQKEVLDNQYALRKEEKSIEKSAEKNREQRILATANGRIGKNT